MVHWLCMTYITIKLVHSWLKYQASRLLIFKNKKLKYCTKKNNWQDVEEIWSVICNGNKTRFLCGLLLPFPTIVYNANMMMPSLSRQPYKSIGPQFVQACTNSHAIILITTMNIRLNFLLHASNVYGIRCWTCYLLLSITVLWSIN